MTTQVQRQIAQNQQDRRDQEGKEQTPNGDESARRERHGLKLSEEAKRFLLREIAGFTPHKEIQRLVQTHHQAEISLALISWYSCNPKWKETIQIERDNLASRLDTIPISSIYYRLRERQKLYQLARDRDGKNKRNLPLANTILESAAKDLAAFQGKSDDPARLGSVVNLKIVNQVLALPAEAQREYIETGKMPPGAYLVDVKLDQPALPAPQPEAETSTESNDQAAVDSLPSVPGEDGPQGS